VLEVSTRLLDETGATRALTVEDRTRIEAAYEDMAARGLRVIALARRAESGIDGEEHDLVFQALVGLIDPPRPEVRAAIRAARGAGIRIVMITGDSPITARAIADQLGLKVERVLTGAQIDTTDEAALDAALREDILFARAKPAHKLRIVRALQAQGQIAAMTGDGVNDAPALKAADIGVAMGVRGTDVAKDASDLVLLDDNFATIVGAIAEGRRQFDNLRKFVRYLLSSNAGEVIAILANILIGGPLIFLATQILWMNLITDSFTAVALGLEKSEADQMRRPPRARAEPVLGRPGLAMILAFGVYTGAASLWVFYTLLPHGPDLARTAAFTAMVMFEKVSVFAFRSFSQPNWKIGFFSNPLLVLAFVLMVAAQVAAIYWPPLQVLLHTVPLGVGEWAMIAALCAPLLIGPEVIKSLLPRRPVLPS